MTETPRLSSALVDRYTIERELGQGGMATVYLAEDVRHHRKVAIKVLHPELSALLGPERFLKEIELTASLQHPHILPLFDSGNADGLLYYVMPYVEGETLRKRLEREQQLPIGDALRIASEVADALEYAHKRGVVHRDIKPENILLHDGRPLVADFGIALAVQQAGGARMTQTGMSLGTPQYMAPEQAMGDKHVDHRADIYALGAVTYEMLTGEPPFTGPNSQAIVAKVLTTDPTALTIKRRSVPQHVEDAVLTALEKMPADRFGSAAELAEVLGGTKAAAHESARRHTASATPGRGRALLTQRNMLAAAAVALGVVLLAAWLLQRGQTPTEGEPVRFAYALGIPGRDRPYIAISPDGRRIAQSVVDTAGMSRIVVRDLSNLRAVPIPGTELGVDPEFSPDGAWIVFNSDGKIVAVPAGGGPRRELADSASYSGLAWMPDGSIIYTHSNGRSLWRIWPGGKNEQVTKLDTARREFAHWWPQVLPGGRAVIYGSYATPISRARIEAYEFATGRTKVLVEGALFGRYSRTGHLLYTHDAAIFAIPFDTKRLEVRGTAAPVQDDVYWNPTDGLAGYAISSNGTLVYNSAAAWRVEHRLLWVDREGREQPVLAAAASYAEPRISPDGRRIALAMEQPRREVWVYDIGRGALTRVARSEGAAFNPIWTPDGRSLIYTHETPVYDLYRVPVDGSAPTRELIATQWDKYASAISPDGRILAYTEVGTVDEIRLVPLDGSEAPRTLGRGRVWQRNAVFSPNGRWIGYEEASAGERSNIYVAAVDGSGGRQQVSTDGGTQPRWTRGGREIVYRRGEAMMAAAIDPATGEAGRPVELFRMPHHSGLGGGRTLGYDVTPDGNRFLVVKPVHRPDAQPTVVVLNWLAELKAKTGR